MNLLIYKLDITIQIDMGTQSRLALPFQLLRDQRLAVASLSVVTSPLLIQLSLLQGFLRQL